MPRFFRLIHVAAVLAMAQSDALGQASYVEDFDNNGSNGQGQFGPSNLVAKGWQFRMQCQPASDLCYFDGYHGWGWPSPHTGPGYLATDAFMPSDGPVSNWAILPAVPGQQAGDGVTIHARRVGALDTRIEIRYSPSGGTSTGSGPFGVGDFTQVLAAADPVPTGGWFPVMGEAPGPGRIAIRFMGDFVMFSGGMYTALDTLSVGPPPPPPCNLPPVPQPGQEVTWTLAGSPYRVCTDLLIPKGGKVTVEPGVVVNIDPGRGVSVDGTLVAHGSAQTPITFTGGDSYFPAPISVPTGTLDLRYGSVSCRIHGGMGASLLIADSAFAGKGTVSGEGNSIFDDNFYSYIQVERCSFGPGGMLIQDGTLVLRDCTFSGGTVQMLRGTIYADRNTFDGAQLNWIQEWPGQSALIDTITVKNNPGRAGIFLDGGNYLLGPGTVLQNNLYPVAAKAGLLPGSAVPVSGNANNAVHVPLDSQTPRGRLIWSDLAVPYVVEGSAMNGMAGYLRIDPGTTVRFAPGSGWSFMGGQRLVAEGLPKAPITFEAASPGQPWIGMSFNSNRYMPRLEDCIVRGSQAGVVSSDTPNTILQNCLIEDNGHGASGVVFGMLRARKTLFRNNGTGVYTDWYPVSHGVADLDGATNPNAFEGNGLAVEITNPDAITPARHNWWGHASGPRHPQNPGGQGDEIGGIGASSVQIFPFRTTPPDFSDHPPVVRMKEPYFLQRTGEKLIIEWDAQDDGSIVSQKVLFTEHGNNPDFSVIAELPPSQRRYEFTVPVIPGSSNNNSPFVRILAIDNAGQQAFDEVFFDVPYTEDWSGTLTHTTDLSGVFRPGERVEICWEVGDGASGGIDAWVFLDGDDAYIPLGGAHTGVNCLGLGMTVPYVSTDTARIGLLLASGAGGRFEWFFSEPFTIRPDPRLGDAAPTVQVISPAEGSGFYGGGTVPISWEASDDVGLRSSSIQASYDGGRTWHFIARDLPGSDYLWPLPPSAGIADVRVRIIATDSRFQNSSDAVGISILAGEACPADCDGSGSLDIDDFICFQTLFGMGDAKADCDGSGGLDIDDFICFQTAFGIGCP